MKMQKLGITCHRLRKTIFRRTFSLHATGSFFFLSFALSLAMFAACDSDTDGPGGKSGQLRLNLAADTTSVNKGINSNPTKAVSADEFEKFLITDDYKVAVRQDTVTIEDYERYDQIPEAIRLNAGAYTLTASKGEDKPAAFENPYFEGSTDFTIKADMITPLEVTCTLANARITVDYTDDFKDMYSEYAVLLSTKFTKEKLEISQKETRPAYVKVAPEGTDLGIAIRLQKWDADTAKTYYVPKPLALERRQSIRLIFKTDGAGLDGIGLDILLDDELISETFEEKIPDFMWQQFDKPTLASEQFGDGSFTLKAGKFEQKPSIIFGMPAGIGSFIIKQWREDTKDTLFYDLATAEGVTAAHDAKFYWNLNNSGSLKNIRQTGQLYLDKAMNNLEAPEEDNYTYHFEFYGKDNLPKANQTNVLKLKAIVQAAGLPIISFEGFPEAVLVEGDRMSAPVNAVFDAEGLIDDASTVTISDGTTSKTYALTNATHTQALLNEWGIELNLENPAKATLHFPEDFSERLGAPESGERTYTYTFHLKDQMGKTFDLTKTVTLQAPALELTPSENEGDVFARRAILRAKLAVGHPERFQFQWRENGRETWNNCPDKAYPAEAICDTLTGLEPGGKSYQIRAIYNNKENRATKPVTFTTESEIPLEGGDFENWWSKEVYKKTSWSFGTTGLGIDQWWPHLEGATSWWDTRNNLTTSQRSGVSCYYTSYSGTVGTTDSHSGDKAAEISTIGWGEGNTFTGTMTGVVIKNKSAGMLFIGQHTYNGSETFDYGHAFKARPTRFSFWYKFAPVNGEACRAYVVVENRENGTVELGRGEWIWTTQQDSYAQGSVEINYTNTTLKATHMYVVFLSTTAGSPSVEMDKGSQGALDGYSDSRYVGNRLTIDDVELIYE